MKTRLLPTPPAEFPGAQKEKEVLLSQDTSPGIHADGGSGALAFPSGPPILAFDEVEGPAACSGNVNGVGANFVVGYESVYERDMFAEAL